MIPNEDFVPVDSPYSWSNASGTPLEDFLVKVGEQFAGHIQLI